MTTAPPTMPDQGVDGSGAVADRPADASPGVRVTLPPSGSGERRRRRQERRRERRRSLAVLMISLGLLVGAVGVVLGGLDLVDDRFDDPERAGDADPATPSAASDDGASRQATAPAPAGTAGLLVQQTADGAVAGVTAFFVGGGGTGGSALMVPVGSMVEVPSFGLEPVGRSFVLGGLPLLQQTVENLLGVRFDRVAVAGPDDLRELIEPLGAVTVPVPERVEEVQPSGRVRVLFEPGTQAVDAGAAVVLLEARGEGTDVARLVRHQGFWQAWIDAVGADDTVLPGGSAGAAPLGGIFRSLAAGSLRTDLLPVHPLGTGLSSDGDLYEVDHDALAALMVELSPAPAGAVDGERISVQLLNGAGVPGLAQRVTPVLVAAGAEVKLVGNADRFDYATTQVVYYARDRRAAAEAVRDALGVGDVVLSRQPLGVVDVTVVVGTDYTGTGDGDDTGSAGPTDTGEDAD